MPINIEKHKTDSTMKDVQCREVIISRIRRRGKGIEGDPIRVITEVFEKDGTKIAEYDPHVGWNDKNKYGSKDSEHTTKEA